MKKTLAVGIVSLSDKAINALEKNGINSLQELIARRDAGLLISGEFDEESFKELQDACNSVDYFNTSLKRNLFLPDNSEQRLQNITRKRAVYTEGRYTLIKLKDAVLELFNRVPERKLNITDIERILRKVFGDDLSEDYATIGATLLSLAEEKKIERVDNVGNYKLVKKVSSEEEVIYSFDKIAKLKTFLDKNIGKEIEFHYRTSRARSEKKLRRIRLYSQDDRCFYATECYPSGRRIGYLKERVVDYRVASNK